MAKLTEFTPVEDRRYLLQLSYNELHALSFHLYKPAQDFPAIREIKDVIDEKMEWSAKAIMRRAKENA
jgi:hypothetical protein